MATTVLDKQIQEEGYRNAVVRLTGSLAAGEDEVRWIQLSDFSNNDPMAGHLVGLRVDCVNYSIGDGLQIKLEWASDSPQLIVALAGRGSEKFWFGGGLIPDRNRSGYDGSISVRTTGFPPGTVQNFTLELKLVKLYA